MSAMDAGDVAAIITSVAAVVGAIAALYGAVKVNHLEHNTNSMKDELVKEVRAGAMAAGLKQGRSGNGSPEKRK